MYVHICVFDILRYIWRYNIVNKKVWFFFKCIPFAPILSVILYFGSNQDGCFTKKFLKKMGLERDYYSDTTRKTSPIERWFIQKLQKHMGFILESILEAFPNAILQMIAIVLYERANIIAIISILLSMTSVSTKALIFSRSIDNKTFLFNWLTAVADFFGIFFIISWVFYDSNINWYSFNTFINSFTPIGQIWIYQVCNVLFIQHRISCTGALYIFKMIQHHTTTIS